jgi:hypothetical protein
MQKWRVPSRIVYLVSAYVNSHIVERKAQITKRNSLPNLDFFKIVRHVRLKYHQKQPSKKQQKLKTNKLWRLMAPKAGP